MRRVKGQSERVRPTLSNGEQTIRRGQRRIFLGGKPQGMALSAAAPIALSSLRIWSEQLKRSIVAAHPQ